MVVPGGHIPYRFILIRRTYLYNRRTRKVSDGHGWTYVRSYKSQEAANQAIVEMRKQWSCTHEWPSDEQLRELRYIGYIPLGYFTRFAIIDSENHELSNH